MKKEVKKWPALSLTEKQKYLNDLLINDNKFKRHYNEAVKYFNIVKKDLNSIIFSSYDDVDINLFLENKLGEVLIEYFSKLVQFENVDNSEKLYNTLYYLSFEYIKIVKKDKQRQLIIDSHLPDLKVLVDLFSKQALNKNTFSKFSFNDLSLKTIIGFLVENNIRIYQTEGKTISKEESEATIVYSLIDLYMTSKLENVFLVEHLEDYRQLVTDTLKIQEEIGIKEKELKEFFSR
ncbi:MAG: hypothetical protein RSB72_01440, partial [Bacilli bacterium]